jgi:ActR/RegA family two-component response regulator
MPNRPISILYIDDDPGLTRLVQKALGRRGYLVEASSTGESGLARLALGASTSSRSTTTCRLARASISCANSARWPIVRR